MRRPVFVFYLHSSLCSILVAYISGFPHYDAEPLITRDGVGHPALVVVPLGLIAEPAQSPLMPSPRGRSGTNRGCRSIRRSGVYRTHPTMTIRTDLAVKNPSIFQDVSRAWKAGDEGSPVMLLLAQDRGREREERTVPRGPALSAFIDTALSKTYMERRDEFLELYVAV